MENGNGDHATNGNGAANGHVESLISIRYRVMGGGPRVRYSPSTRFLCCPYKETRAYPNDLVLSINDERRQLVVTNRALFQEIKELNAMVDAQGVRILELVETEREKDRALKRFLKFAPPKFIGGPNPEVEENWLERMTIIFTALNYTEERRMNFAAFQFESVARAWYAPELVATERRRIRQFVQEFNVEIQEGLVATQISTFTEILEKAQRVESARLQVKDFQAKKRGASSHSPGQASKGTLPTKMERGARGVRAARAPRRVLSRGGSNGQGQARGTPPSRQAVAPQVVCSYCGKPNHMKNECWRKSKKCLYCGSAEHQLLSCPSVPNEGGSAQRLEKSASKQSSARGSRPKVLTRVYALDHQQIPDSTEVVEGTIPMFHRLVKVLIDPGATHYFVNPNFMSGIDVKPIKLPYDLEVRTPTGDQNLITNLVYKNCEIWVGERKLLADLMSLAIKGYDVILGMDWLTHYHTQLNC
nr:uncharacterized protein LOC113700806 [Coffea arabica]